MDHDTHRRFLSANSACSLPPCGGGLGRGSECGTNGASRLTPTPLALAALRRVTLPTRGRVRKKLRRLGARTLLGRRDRARALDLGDLAGRITQHLAEDFVGVLAEQRRACHLAG